MRATKNRQRAIGSSCAHCVQPAPRGPQDGWLSLSARGMAVPIRGVLSRAARQVRRAACLPQVDQR
eukprot:4000330-Pleurochrysis_carterae.AAC.1